MVKAGRHDHRELAIVLAGLAVASATVLAGTSASSSIPLAPFLPLGLAAMAFGAWLVLAAMAGSRTAIILYFMLLCFVVDAQFRARGAGEISSDWQSALKFALWLGAGAIGSTHLPPLRALLARPGSALWLCYICVAMLSSLYSPIPGYSFGCSFALLCLFAFAFAVTQRLSESEILWTLGLTLAAFCLAGWVVFYVYPALGTSPFWTYGGMYLRMCGLAGQANNLGAICSKGIGCAFLLWYGRRCGFLAALLLGSIAFVTLLKSDARTGELAVMAGVGAVMASRSRLLMGALTLAGVGGFLLLQVFPGLLRGLGAAFSRSGDPSEIYTLTGRLEIWAVAVRRIAESPLLGYGYNATKVVLGNYYDLSNGLMVDSAHNMYLQSMLSVGMLGTAPLLGLLIYLGYRFFVRPVAIVSYFFIVILVSSVSDTDAIGTTPTLMSLVFFIISVWPGLDGKAAPERIVPPVAPGRQAALAVIPLAAAPHVGVALQPTPFLTPAPVPAPALARASPPLPASASANPRHRSQARPRHARRGVLVLAFAALGIAAAALEVSGIEIGPTRTGVAAATRFAAMAFPELRMPTLAEHGSDAGYAVPPVPIAEALPQPQPAPTPPVHDDSTAPPGVAPEPDHAVPVEEAREDLPGHHEPVSPVEMSMTAASLRPIPSASPAGPIPEQVAAPEPASLPPVPPSPPVLAMLMAPPADLSASLAPTPAGDAAVAAPKPGAGLPRHSALRPAPRLPRTTPAPTPRPPPSQAEDATPPVSRSGATPAGDHPAAPLREVHDSPDGDRGEVRPYFCKSIVAGNVAEAAYVRQVCGN